jgi:hypothetical protein
MVFLTKPKCFEIQRDSKGELRKPKFQECAEKVRLVKHTSQTDVPYPRASPVSLPASRAVYQTCPIQEQPSPVNNMIVGI